MLTAGTMMMLFLGMIYAWSIFRVEIKAVFQEFTAAQLSLNFTIMMTSFCLGGFLGGILSERFSQRFSVRLSAVMVFSGLIGASFMGSLRGDSALTLMYISYGAVCGLGTGIGYNACLTGVSPWYPKRLGLVSGILLMGYGLGSLFLGLLAKLLSQNFGVFNIFRLYSVVILLVLFTGSFFLKKPEMEKNQDVPEDSCTPVQMLGKASFWILFVWNVIMSSSGLLIINSAASISLFFGATAVLGLLVSVFNGIGRPFAGAVMDKFGKFAGMAVMNSLLIAAGILLLVTTAGHSMITLFAGMFIIGLCYGGGVTISAKVVRELFGPRHYAVNFSIANFCMIPASFVGPYISGVLQDRSGGSYISSFMMLLAMSVIAMIIIILLKGVNRKEISHT